MGQRRTSGFALVAVTASLVLVGLPASPAAAADVAQSKVVAANPTDWTPDVLDGEVHSITQVGSLMIAGGLFSQVRAPGAAAITGRSNVVAFDATTGVINASFAPQVDGEVDAVVPSADGTQVYLAGAFNNVGGVRRPSLALVNVADGSLVEAFKPPVFDGVINDAALVSNELWVVGNFTFPNTVVATIDPTTGSYDGFAPLTFAGAHTPGSHTSGRSIDISPEGTRAVIGGNFATIDGLDREQLVMLDLTGPKAAVLSTWQTNDFKTACAPQFDSAVHDVEFSTDGAYFVVGTSGGGTPDHPSLCDAVSRWETGASGSDLHPTWVDSTGGDTVTGTAVTGAAVYAGGHFRWFNNPYSTNAPGPGAVPRSGLVALDPATGLPLRWNPGRDRGVGVFDFFATSTGLWVGSDTDQVGGEQHGRIALFPVAGGDAVPRPSSGALPTRVYRVGQGPATTARALYRVNAGGPPVLATDGGPAWAGDQGVSLRHNAGTVPETWNPVQVVDSSVPTSTPPAVFSDDLTTLGQAPDMHWTFPVAAGTPVSVRLYFAEQNGAFSAPGKRIFNVDVEGRRMLDNFDIMWGAGYKTGTMRSADVVSDGTINIDLLHGAAGTPLIDAVEIVPTCGVVTTAGANDVVAGRSFDGTVAGPAATVPTAGRAWSQSRGAFMLSGTAYTGWSDGHLCAATFDGSAFTDWHTVPLYDNTFAVELPLITGMFYADHAIYYARSDSTSLFSRPFTPDTGTVGATKTLASDSVSGIDFSKVAGMFVASGKLYFVTRSDGVLHRIDWHGGAPVGGTETAVSGPSLDGVTWAGQGLFPLVAASATAPNEVPHANLAANCTYLNCALTSVGSGDPDGTIATYSWDFGDGSASAARTPTHSYAAAGQYTIRLTVTDSDGATASAATSVSVVAPNQPPVASFTASCSQLSCVFDGSSSHDGDGSVTTYSWSFGDGSSGSGQAPHHEFASAGAYTVKLTVTDNSGATDGKSRTLNVVVGSSAIDFVGESSTAGTSRSWFVDVPSGVADGDGLLLVATFASATPNVTPPAGWTLVGSRKGGSLDTEVYQRVAVASDAGEAVEVTAPAVMKADVSVMAYRGTSRTAPVAAFAAAAPGGVSSSAHTTPTVTVPADGSWVVSLWADKSSSTATTTLSPPSGQATRHQACGTGTGHICALATDGGGPVNAGTTAGGLTATAAWSSASDSMWTIVLNPS